MFFQSEKNVKYVFWNSGAEILVENRRLNLPHLYLAPPLGVTPWNFA